MAQLPRPVALVSARTARDLDEDLPPLLAAFHARRLPVEVVDWDDEQAEGDEP